MKEKEKVTIICGAINILCGKDIEDMLEELVFEGEGEYKKIIKKHKELILGISEILERFLLENFDKLEAKVKEKSN